MLLVERDKHGWRRSCRSKILKVWSLGRKFISPLMVGRMVLLGINIWTLDWKELNSFQDDIDMLIQHDLTIVEKDLNHDPVALALDRDNRGRVRGLGMGVSKTTIHHSTPYRRYEMASQAAIKTVVDELKEQNIQLRERLEEESRERKRMEKRILSCLS